MPEATIASPPPGARVAPIRQSGPPREINAASLPGRENRQPRVPPPSTAAPPPPPPPASPPAPARSAEAAPAAAATVPPKKPDTAAEREARATKFAEDHTDRPATPPETPPAAPETPPEPNAPPAEGTPAAEVKKGKVNPWKLVDEYKGKVATLESELLKAKNSVLPEADREAFTKRVTAAEQRAKELEDHIRFVDYSKSSEFVEKYDKPYQAAFLRAISELAEISVIDGGTQQPRAAGPQDLQAILALPLGEARDLAEEVFGKFAGEVMGHRKEIKALLDQRTNALKDAKEQGALRETQTREQQQRQIAETTTFVRNTYQELLAEADKEPVAEFFSPKAIPEGQQPTAEETEWNTSLQRGENIVNEGWAGNPADPNLTPDHRKHIIKQHIAIRKRAAAFGPMKLLIKTLRAENEAMKAELNQYDASNPGAGGSMPAATPTGTGDPRADRERRAEEFARKRAQQ